jgi:pimeloyl-ACP methyl ester carboxylesterase
VSGGAAFHRVTVALSIALALALGFAAFLAYLYLSQERMIFPGAPLPPDHDFRFEQPFEEVTIEVPGAKLHGLRFLQPEPDGLVFFLHGNGGDVSTWTDDVELYRALNYDLFVFDYRGYGKSTGAISSEAALHADVRAAWDRIAPHYAQKPIVVYGRSLGTGLAVALAREVDPALVVLATPYRSMAAVVDRLYPIAPRWLLKYPLRTDAMAADVRAPVLIVHGTHDELLPLDDALALQPLFRPPAELVVVDGAAHNDIQAFAAYREALARHLRALRRPRRPLRRRSKRRIPLSERSARRRCRADSTKR